MLKFWKWLEIFLNEDGIRNNDKRNCIQTKNIKRKKTLVGCSKKNIFKNTQIKNLNDKVHND